MTKEMTNQNQNKKRIKTMTKYPMGHPQHENGWSGVKREKTMKNFKIENTARNK